MGGLPGLPYPRVIYTENPEQLSIEFPSAIGSHKMAGNVRIRVLTTVDGAYLTEKVPYFGKDATPRDDTIVLRT